MNDRVTKYVSALYEHGVSTYDREAKVAVNVGGAAFFGMNRWKNPDNDQIHFNYPQLENVLKSLFGITLYAVDRVLTDDEGQPIPVPPERGEGMQRGVSCLGIACSLTSKKNIADLIKAKILSSCPELEGLVVTAGELLPQLYALEGAKVVDGTPTLNGPEMYDQAFRTWNPIPAHAFVFIFTPSGMRDSNTVWARGSKQPAAQEDSASSEAEKNSGLGALGI